MSSRTETKTRPKAPLTRERIAAAAVRIMDREGLDAVSMRGLGEELGVSAMSLYNHVEDKGDLYVAILDEVMAEFTLPPDDVTDWETRARHLARSYRDVLIAHPGVMQVFAEVKKPSTSVHSLRPIEEALVTLRASGLSEKDAAEAYRMLGGYIMGFALMESRHMFELPDDVPIELVIAEIPDELPMLKANFAVMCLSDKSMDFEFGLDVMLAGINARVARTT